ncbi:MAG: hypothetical protein ACE5IL_00660 [Myxococcota bacterium]
MLEWIAALALSPLVVVWGAHGAVAYVGILIWLVVARAPRKG